MKGRPASLQVWERVALAFGFSHIARVEVVTSHTGCRAQGWHIDASHGLTVIFPLTGVDITKGPTQVDFVTPFNTLDRSGKVKHHDRLSPDYVHAAMPAGSVVMFNANCSHRGTANLSATDRPILVLDCSLPCESADCSVWDFPVSSEAGSEPIDH